MCKYGGYLLITRRKDALTACESTQFTKASGGTPHIELCEIPAGGARLRVWRGVRLV